MPRHIFTQEERIAGGKARSQMASFSEACSKGFWRCMETHPFWVRKHLKKKIKSANKAKKAKGDHANNNAE